MICCPVCGELCRKGMSLIYGEIYKCDKDGTAFKIVSKMEGEE